MPQHATKRYQLFISDKTSNFKLTKANELPDIQPGEKINLEVDDLPGGGRIVTVVRPNGYIVTQKSFY